jgi:hypothetical protein
VDIHPLTIRKPVHDRLGQKQVRVGRKPECCVWCAHCWKSVRNLNNQSCRPSTISKCYTTKNAQVRKRTTPKPKTHHIDDEAAMNPEARLPSFERETCERIKSASQTGEGRPHPEAGSLFMLNASNCRAPTKTLEPAPPNEHCVWTTQHKRSKHATFMAQ